MPKHQVFVSYNSRDAALAHPVAQAMKDRGLNPWLDHWDIPLGRPWQPVVDAGLAACTAVVVLLGPNGLGPVQGDEVNLALELARRQGKPVIPVLLPGAVPLTGTLTTYPYLELGQGEDAAALDRLAAALAAGSPAAPVRPAPREFTLQVAGTGNDLQAHWGDGETFPLPLPLTKADLDELAWYLERYVEFPGAGDRARAATLEQRLDDWGRALWAALFPGGAHNGVYAAIRDHLNAGGRCLLTLASDSPAFLIRPWEMLRDAKGPLALRGLTLRRRLPGNPTQAAFQLGLPLRVLLIVSRPEDTGFIDPRTSTRPVLDALAQTPGGVEVDFCEPPTLPELERQLAAARRERRPYHIVHFDGHGQYLPETGVGVLCFEGPEAAGRKTELVAGRRLGDLLSRLQVPLVLLEACRGAQVSDRPIFGAVAPALLQGGVGSVVAFSHSVHVRAATLLVERLYRELVAGASVGEALEEARAALHADRKRWLTLGPDAETLDLQDWPIPQLYQAGADPVLVPGGAAPGPDPTRGLASDPADPDPIPGFPPPPRYGFQGRARELLALERALGSHPAVLLHAGGGMGKTALAREAAHWWRRTRRFEAALFHSFEQGEGAEGVVRRIGEGLGGEGFASLAPDDQWAEAVLLFRRSQVLLVWDNFESVLPVFVGSAVRTEAGTEPAVGSAVRTEAGTDPSDTHAHGPHSGPYGHAGPAGTAGDGPHSGPYGPALLPDLQRLYRDLTQGQPRGRLLITCRPAETGLDGPQELPLAGLARHDALYLLRGACTRKAINLDRPGYGREAIEALLDRLEDHPLSIELVAPHLATLTPETIAAELAERLGDFRDDSHAEGRNRSLLASLDFSLRRLSPAAREALPWLGWFQSGVFEAFFLDFSEIPGGAWAPMRAELTATALLRVEDLAQFNTPYLKLHPTLAEAAAPDLGDGDRVGRFVAVYLGVMGMIDQALRGSQPAAGMALMGLEQGNLRRALGLAFEAGRHRDGGMLAFTLRDYLERAGRLRERDRLTEWVRERMPEGRLDGATCAAIQQHAWTLFTQGRTEEALDSVQGLESRLLAGGLQDGDLTFQLAMTRTHRGRIRLNAGRPDLALEPLGQAIDAFRALGEGQRGNLSAALGDLANALMLLGRYDRALTVADEGLGIDRDLGRDQAVAAGLGRTAAILMDSGRHAEAEARFGEALAAAERVGDLGLQGIGLQRLGGLQRDTGRTAESVETLRRALRAFQQSGDRGGEMQTCDLLGSAELTMGRLDPADAWFRKALGLAEGLGDQAQVGATRQNLGILSQDRAEATQDPAERDRHLATALAEVGASLAITQAQGNRVGEARSRFQLGILQRLRGDLGRAEAEARQALAIREDLDHPDVLKDYANLAHIARARGDQAGAVQWQAKADAKLEEVERLAAGPGPAGLDPRLVEALMSLARAVHGARTQGRALEPDAAEALAQVMALPDPLGPFGRFLDGLARGANLEPPAGLPAPLDRIAAALLEALA